jgi:DNA-binding PadR family transcriptional regulator
LRFLQPAHGYLIRQELESWSASEWANIAYGSIYHALGKMAEEGLVVEVEREAGARKLGRVKYQITPKGEEEFQRMLRQGWWTIEPVVNPFMVAFSFINDLPREEIIAGLRQRARAREGQIRHMIAEQQSAEWLADYKPPHVAEQMRLMQAHLQVEADFSNQLADRLEAGDTLDGEIPLEQPVGTESN